MNNKEFNFFSNRLHFIEATGDQKLNIELHHYVYMFESYVYGVFMQYKRIRSDLDFKGVEIDFYVPKPQLWLDIYYYILTWDKLKKIYNKIRNLASRIQQSVSSVPDTFKQEYKLWTKRVDHLFSEFDNGIRNEYEHPSLEFHIKGNIMIWGSIYVDGRGNIKTHAGKNWFVTIKNEHCSSIQKLRIVLIDLFIKHFTQKPLTEELIKLKKHIEDNIGAISKELKELYDKDDTDGFNNLLNRFTMYEIHLSKEGMPLAEDIKNKVYSILAP